MRRLLLVLGLLSFAAVAAIRATGATAGAAEQLLAVWSYLAIVRGLGLDRWLVGTARLAIAEMRAGATAASAGRADA